MDAIPSGLTSVTPILPETMLVAGKGGINGPPVEIIPLPDNSFMSDGAMAEMLNNPFTLDLDIKGSDGGDEADVGSPAGGRAGAPTGGMPPAEEPAPGAAGNAYELSLGGGEEVPAASGMALELARAKNYEMLGKAAPRQIYRNPDTQPAEPNAPGAPNKTSALISGSVRNLLEQLVGQEEIFTRAASPEPELPWAAAPEDAPGAKAGAGEVLRQAGQAPVPARTEAPQRTPVFLTPSDYEAIFSLEPELQETLINMLGEGGIIIAPAERKSAAGVPVAGRNISNETGPENSIPGNNMVEESAPGKGTATITMSVQGREADIRAAFLGQPVASAARLPDFPPRTMPPAAVPGAAATEPAFTDARIFDTDDGAGRLMAALLTGAAARDIMPEGNMANLKKITELPYSLYLFGPAAPGKRPPEEEEEEAAPSKGEALKPAGQADYLKRSEAVKMAAVLHNIYHGGSGSFPEETPWYAPYVRYAVRNGIIKSGEFDDFSAFATRAETAYIFSGCVPREELPALNDAPALSDVEKNAGYGGSVYLLYRAGVFAVSDGAGRFRPEGLLTRSEAATIVGRIATPADRKRL
ncbi:S-layer homology domain-containing protein [Sporobacter termitidis DSM 10068]|uniref:S-layer homology domain-containing protein n=1 Tax=Sporobacter termitidis DSM 10068 TaxID=1123282 RepID=A0A1M5WDA1_9FIRM|nr:S-layer homology domain-containing protein [Sporobacter termitidis]SHH85204.1 S-layer homology domain-containing protein [Sporobacter termitidis DSM 10068]